MKKLFKKEKIGNKNKYTIFGLIKFTIKNKKAKKDAYLTIDKSSVLLKSFSIRRDVVDTSPITIGKDCMLNCNIIFESDKGEVEIGDRVFINAGTSIISRSKVKFGNDITVAWDCVFYDHNSHSLNWEDRKNDMIQQLDDYKTNGNFIKNKNWNIVKSRPIEICDKAWIGFGVTVLNGVKIGEGAIVGAQSVVRNNVEPYTIVAGNPAVEIGKVNRS